MRVEVKEKRYGGTPILADISLSVAPGEFVAIIGPSGIGKTTLLRIAAGLDKAFTGHVERTEKTAFVFQEPRLLPWRTVAENVALALPPAPDNAARTTVALASVGLAGREQQFPRALSVGQARRVSLARALAISPDLLMLDEPLVSLDEASAKDLRGLIARLWQENQLAALLITHNLEEAVELADRIILINGRPANIRETIQLAEPRESRDAAWVAATSAQLRVSIAADT